MNFASTIANDKTVLLFDDDIHILEACSMILEHCGYKIATSTTVENVVAQVIYIQPDVILMDNWIPDIGGIKATQLLKQHPEIAHIPVVYVSANNDVELLAQQAGADTFLAKPFDMHELERIVKRFSTEKG